MTTDVQARTQVRLFLLIDREGFGGVPGLAPTVALRWPGVAGRYLDWADNTFKTVGWSLRRGAMTEVSASLSPGEYEKVLDLAATVPVLADGDELVVEFDATNGVDINRRAADVLSVRETVEQLGWVYAVHHNRIEDTPGTPGIVSVYRPDNVTVWQTAQLRDYTGGGVGGTTGLPARRTGFS
jgi:hypothetical protein